MTNLTPWPADGCIRCSIDAHRILHVVAMDRGHNGRIDGDLARSIRVLADRIAAEAANLTGVVMRAESPGWFGRTDLLAVAGDDAGALDSWIEASTLFASALRKIELAVPVVAILEGSAIGSGLEWALACHRRIALDDSRLRFGLSDIAVNVLPSAGGASRLTRIMGYLKAWREVLLPGTTFDVRSALELGLVDEIAPSPQAALQASIAWLLAHQDSRQPWDRKGFVMPEPTPESPAGYFTLHALPAQLRREFPAIEARNARIALLSAVVEGGLMKSIDHAMAIERRSMISVLRQPSTRRLVQRLHLDLLQEFGEKVLSMGASDILDQTGKALSSAATGPDRAAAASIRAALHSEAEAMLKEGIKACSIERAALQAGFAPGALDMTQPNDPRDGRTGQTDAKPVGTRPEHLAPIAERLLRAGAAEALRITTEGSGNDRSAHLDWLSIAYAGFPADTGGALTYARALRVA